MEAIYLVCSAGGPQLKRNPLGGRGMVHRDMTRILALIFALVVLHPIPSDAQRLPPLDSTGIPLAQRRELHAFTTPHLLALLTDDSLTYTSGLGYPDTYQLAVAYELVRRQPYTALCQALAQPLDIYRQPSWVGAIIEHLRSPAADSCMKGLATSDSTYTAYLAAKYFAESGQEWALGRLDENFWRYHFFAFDLQDLIQLFGRYRYRPAAKHLAEAMGALNVSTVGLAEEALRAIFPEVDTSFTDPTRAQAFWAHYVATHASSKPSNRP